jgi:hypothetical protein
MPFADLPRQRVLGYFLSARREGEHAGGAGEAGMTSRASRFAIPEFGALHERSADRNRS